jgi:nitric oxide reductase NorD protein
VADAEDVVLDAARHVAAGTRALWERYRGAVAASDAAASAGRRRLDCWLAAVSGRSFETVEVDPPPAPGWLERIGSKPAPWQLRPRGVAASDGRILQLPAGALLRLGSSRAAADLLPALGLALRGDWDARASGGGGLPPLARDVAWLLESADLAGALARMLPGLRAELDAARRRALEERPPVPTLGAAERAAEEIARSLLCVPCERAAAEVERLLEGEASPPRIRDFARRFAASFAPAELRSYRGIAPVAAWGAPLSTPGGDVASGRHATEGRSRAVGRRLRRPIARRAADAPAPRSGPFLLAPGDPHRSVQDARGLDRPLDRGDEALDALADELAQLRELPTVETEQAVREILESPAGPGARSGRAARGAGAGALLYPEWDHGSRSYRPRACAVRECETPARFAAPAARDRALLRRVRRQFEALRPRRQRISRRLDGDGIDLDAWVLEFAERRAGCAQGERLYTAERHARRDVAVALLLDASGSTDAWISQSRRVIDVAKEAAVCFCEALAALGDRVAVYAFSGRRAGDVKVWVPKRFGDPYGPGVRARIEALEPDRFTRLGGPLRHVTASLARVGARVRVLLLLSDGKPNDEDDYGGEYGVEDVRQAVVEARALGVRPFCITIDREAPSYLPRIFGASGYTVLWDVHQLPLRLPRLYRRVTAGA